jgi:rhodanese-related sulfurtransferase
MAGWLRRVGEVIAGATALICAFACGASSEIPEIPAGALIVDVRSPGEYQAGHFPGAVNIPVDEIGQRTSELGEKDKRIVVYCRAGRRAALAKVQLEKAGFTNVVNGGSLEAMMRLAPSPSSAEQ